MAGKGELELGIALQAMQEKKAHSSRGRGLLRGFLELRRHFVEICTQTLFQVGLGASSDEQAMAELRPVRQQSGFTHSGSLLLQGQ